MDTDHSINEACQYYTPSARPDADTHTKRPLSGSASYRREIVYLARITNTRPTLRLRHTANEIA